jgi:HAD superfamily hydrolase (TIGR01549 family)
MVGWMDRLKQFKAQAIIFDKDGTLIDFDAMWGGWAVYLAGQLQLASGLDMRDTLCDAMGYDQAGRKVIAGGKLASQPMSFLRDLTVEVMQSQGLSSAQAETIVEKAWCIPDPVLLAKPLTDIRALFSALQEKGIKIAIATADDRAPTQAMIEAFDIESYISAMVCGDDGINSKPAADMALHLCEKMNVDPSHVMVLGDTVSDMKMAHAAGIGLAVGVLSGVSTARDLASHADVLIESVDDLHTFVLEFSANAPSQTTGDLDPDFAF